MNKGDNCYYGRDELAVRILELEEMLSPKDNRVSYELQAAVEKCREGVRFDGFGDPERPPKKYTEKEYYELVDQGRNLFKYVVHDLNQFMSITFQDTEQRIDYRTMESFQEICIALALLENK